MRVFISFRSDDVERTAERLANALRGRYGPRNVLMTVEGAADQQAGESAVTSCDAAIVLVGPRWLDAGDGHGGNGDGTPSGIQAALARAIPIIPVLVDGASLPEGEQLPPPLRALIAQPRILRVEEKISKREVNSVLDALERGAKAAPKQSPQSTQPEPTRQPTQPGHTWQPTLPKPTRSTPRKQSRSSERRPPRPASESRRISPRAIVAGVLIAVGVVLAIVVGVSSGGRHKNPRPQVHASLPPSNAAITAQVTKTLNAFHVDPRAATAGVNRHGVYLSFLRLLQLHIKGISASPGSAVVDGRYPWNGTGPEVGAAELDYSVDSNNGLKLVALNVWDDLGISVVNIGALPATVHVTATNTTGTAVIDATSRRMTHSEQPLYAPLNTYGRTKLSVGDTVITHYLVVHDDGSAPLRFTLRRKYP